MRNFIYLDNIRGFQKALVPIEDVCFLTGENSTGKTSFLRAVKTLLSKSIFADYSSSPIDSGDPDYEDSLLSGIRHGETFTLGACLSDNSRPAKSIARLHKFKVVSGKPKLVRHDSFQDNLRISVVLDASRVRVYRRNHICDTLEKEVLAPDDDVRSSDWQKLGQIEAYSGIPLLTLASMAINQSAPEVVRHLINAEASIRRTNVIWIAPIRSRPRRIYDGRPRERSPDGVHAPGELKRALNSELAELVNDLLVTFGRDSRLFDSIKTRSLGRSKDAPFELLLALDGNERPISSVGYGVSQVLPIVSDVLLSPPNSLLLIQQPEVHLHPRAQAAFGEILGAVSATSGRSFIIETHSDYLIDRYRLFRKQRHSDRTANVLFFQRSETGNQIQNITINNSGRYEGTPSNFREFFINESIETLDL